MNELEFARKVRHQLNLSAAHIPLSTQDRLHGARRAALNKQRVRVSGLSLAGFAGSVSSGFSGSVLRNLAGVVALMLGVALTHYVTSELEADDLAETDSSLLSDDLPINAYLDPGFNTWLAHSSEP